MIDGYLHLLWWTLGFIAGWSCAYIFFELRRRRRQMRPLWTPWMMDKKTVRAMHRGGIVSTPFILMGEDGSETVVQGGATLDEVLAELEGDEAEHTPAVRKAMDRFHKKWAERKAKERPKDTGDEDGRKES